MSDDGIATEDYLYVVTANQVGDVTSCTCMDDGGAKHEENFAATFAGRLHVASNLVNGEHFGFFRGVVTLHESEGFTVAGTFKWMDANTIMVDDDLFSNFHFVHWLAVG